jgi:Flp pilus assembly protein TadD
MTEPFEPLLAQAYETLAKGRTSQAIRLLLKLVAQWPGHAGAHLLLGIALEREYQPQAAAAAYAKALKLMPGLLDEFDQRDAGAQLLHKAADAAQNDPAAQLVRAIAFGMEGRHSDAERELRVVVARDPGHAEAWRLLGNTLAIDGRIEESRTALYRAFELDPDNSAILQDLARHVTLDDRDRSVVQRVERALANRQLAPRQQMRLNFALGKCLDDLGNHRDAMNAFDAANAVRSRLRPFDRVRWTAQVDRQIATFSPVTMTRHAATRAGSERAIFVMGMPRSGTTLVEQILSSHPDVEAGGERMFWGKAAPAWFDMSDDAREAWLARIVQDHARDLDAVSTTAVRVTDKNPFNFAWLGLIRIALPNAFIVHCRRNPIDTCLSCYMTPFSSGNEFAASRGDLVFFYREYERLMAHWRSVIPSHRFLELDYEALVTEPEAVTRRVIAFCELPWHPDCLAPERNRRPINTASVMQARRPIYTDQVARWRRYEPWLGQLRELLP